MSNGNSRGLTLLSRIAVATMVAVLAIHCGGEHQTSSTTKPHPLPPPPPPPSPTAEPSAAASTSNAAASASAAEAAKDPFPAPTSNRGKIGCGAATCAVGAEKCCFVDAGPEESRAACAARNGPCPEQGLGIAMECDEAADCKSGESCCWMPGREGSESYRCAPRPCDGEEMCTRGGTCPTGMRCQDLQLSQRAATGGKCVVAEPGVECRVGGKKTRCGGETPTCCWNPKRKTGQCQAWKDACDVGDGKFGPQLGCAGPSDCAGGRCCYVANASAGKEGSACMNLCDGFFLCTQKSDCPAEDEDGNKLHGCDSAPDLPRGVKKCTYKKRGK